METKEDITEKIKESADIVQIIGENVELRKSGGRFLGLCPFHGEKTPSFTVHPGNQFFYCFGCGESGDVFSYMMKYHNLDFPEAINQLARRYNIELPEKKLTVAQRKQQDLKKSMFAVSKKAAEFFSNCLESADYAKEARGYLERRKIPVSVQKQFGLGYAPSQNDAGWDYLGSKFSKDEGLAAIEAGLLVKKEKGGSYDRFRDRVMFPIYDISGQVCGFGGRIVGEGQPKYMNSSESLIYNKSKSLLGLYQLKDNIRKKDQVILVEGNFDLISLVVHGCDNVVAPLGTSLTREQLRMLKRFASEAVLLFDGDDAGVKAAVRSVPMFLAEQMRGKVALLPKGHDPDTYVQEYGLGGLEKLLDSAQELSEFILSKLIEEHGQTLEGKSAIIEEIKPLVRAASSSLQRSVIIGHFAEKLGLEPAELTGLLKGEVSKETYSPPVQEPPKRIRQEGAVTPLSASQKSLVVFMVLNPGKIKRLEGAGLRRALLGSMGEIILLQIRLLLQKNGDLEPEELLSAIPEGAERSLVADILLNASESDRDIDEINGDEKDCLIYLQRLELKQQSSDLLNKIANAQNEGNIEHLHKLLVEKVEVDKKMQNIIAGR